MNAFNVINEADKLVPNVIAFHKAFTQNDCCNVVLQYANIGTLEDYYEKVRPPKLRAEILKVWRKIFCLSIATAGIHRNSPKDQSADSGVAIFRG